MRRLFAVLLVIPLLALPARAHFVFVLPDADGKTVRVVFSDAPKPDSADLLPKIKQTELSVVGADGKPAPVKFEQKGDAFVAEAPGKGPRVVVGNCVYGVSTRGSDVPFLLKYHAKAVVGYSHKEPPPKSFLAPTPGLDFEILPVEFKDTPVLKVVYQGKPVPEAEVTIYTPGAEKGVAVKTDKNGQFEPIAPEMSGLYATRVNYKEPKEGEHAGMKYKEVRHWATMVVDVKVEKVGEKKAETKAKAEETKPAEDPAASKLLADARAARANWKDFPGFTADVEINVDGKVARGTVRVDAKGKVELKVSGGGDVEWATRELRSIVGHRIDDSTALNTPCAFVDDNTTHPLGRAIRVLNDELHSSYRVRDRQIIVVNRQMMDARFTITVTENTLNEEKKFLPVSYVVNTWDTKTDALKSSATFHHTWQRVGKFDLPATTTIVTATQGGQEAKSIKLSNHKLLP